MIFKNAWFFGVINSQYGGVIMKNFFKNFWKKVKDFFSKPIFETIRDLLLAIVYFAWVILVLYQFSLVLLMGIEETSAILISIAVAGYILIAVLCAFYVYWSIFANGYEWEFRQIRRDINDIRSGQTFSSFNNTLTRSEFKLSMLEQKCEMNDKFRAIEKKIDQLIEQQK